MNQKQPIETHVSPHHNYFIGSRLGKDRLNLLREMPKIVALKEEIIKEKAKAPASNSIDTKVKTVKIFSAKENRDTIPVMPRKLIEKICLPANAINGQINKAIILLKHSPYRNKVTGCKNSFSPIFAE